MTQSIEEGGLDIMGWIVARTPEEFDVQAIEMYTKRPEDSWDDDGCGPISTLAIINDCDESDITGFWSGRLCKLQRYCPESRRLYGIYVVDCLQQHHKKKVNG
jgi:hypothetical protein